MCCQRVAHNSTFFVKHVKAYCVFDINFVGENAVVRLADGKLTVYTNEESFCPEILDKHFFLAEMEAFLNYVIDDVECSDASLDSVCQTMEIVFTEIEAAKKGTSICF